MGKFILSYSDGRYSFSFRASNGQRIATSSHYITKTSAQQAISQTRESSACRDCYLRIENEGNHHFVLVDDTRRVLIRSERFASAEERDRAIHVLQHEAGLAHFADTV